MTYTVKVSELYQRAKEMLDDGMDIVEVDFHEGDEYLPRCLMFCASSKSDFGGTDYDEIYTVKP